MRRTKIVCTLGPATTTPAAIGALIDAGMDVARLNFSHGTHEEHLARLRAVREEARRRGRAVAVLQDLQGPKIRIGRFAGGQVELEAEREFVITTRELLGDERLVSTSYRGLPRDVKPGDRVMLDDGYLQLTVTQVEGEDVRCRVDVGGTLKDRKGINLPGVKVSAPALTTKDRHDLEMGLAAGVDLVALSFVRGPDDVRAAARLAVRGSERVPILAKIERPEAVDRLDEIVAVADGVMVARGDLGVELGPEKVPLVQKQAIATTNARGKLVITATQMLESMIGSPRPTRAEASDVANAVLDGTDALMLSGETATGRYPVQAVSTMARIAEEVERSSYFQSQVDKVRLDLPVSTNAIAHAAVVASRELGLKVIATYSETGGAARLLSEYRPPATIVAFTTSEAIWQRHAAYWGVVPVLMEAARGTDDMLVRIVTELRDRGLAAPGDMAAITLSVPVGTGQHTNMLEIHRVPAPAAPG